MNTRKLEKIACAYVGMIKESYLIRTFLFIAFLSTSFGTFADNECTRTSQAALRACNSEVKDDFWIAKGNCINLPSRSEERACKQEAFQVLIESKEECLAQFDAREEVCEDLGQDPYHPEIDLDNFPYTDGIIPNPNPFFPLVPGTTFIYEGGDEIITVEVTHEIKEILGVSCIVVRDVVEENGEVIEDTFDWYAQDIDGNVWYFGEISQEFEDGELVGVEGSWKAGVEGAKQGIIMKADPQVGDVYRQEFALGNAEDMGRVTDVNGDESSPAASCDGECLVIDDFTPIEPDALENKYYAPGIGFILEVKPETGERVELTEIIIEDDEDDEEEDNDEEEDDDEDDDE